MSGHPSSQAQIDCGSSVNDLYKYKEKKHKKHREHRKEKERERSGNHKDSSGRKHRDRERDRTKRKHGSVDEDRHKDKLKHKERKRDDKAKLLDGKDRKEKGDVFASPPRVKYQPDNDPCHLAMPKHVHSLKRDWNGDNSSDFKPKKIKTGDENRARKRKQDDCDNAMPKHEHSLKREGNGDSSSDFKPKKIKTEDENRARKRKQDDCDNAIPKHEHSLKREGNGDSSSDFKPMKVKNEDDKARKRKQEDCDNAVKPLKVKKLKGEDFDGKKKVAQELKVEDSDVKKKATREIKVEGSDGKKKVTKSLKGEKLDGKKKVSQEIKVEDSGKKKVTKSLKVEELDGKKKHPEGTYKWWNEIHRYTDGTKWTDLEHKGPVFTPEYEPLPDNVMFYYDGEHMKLSPAAEEVATFYAKMLDHEYVTKDIFRENFFRDWQKEMTAEERARIKDLTKCDFNGMSDYFKAESEARRAMSREEKQKIKDENERLLQEYGFCYMDDQKERVANFRTEPPGLFRGRGAHPKMGMLKHRIKPEDCIINCSKGKCPKPPPGRHWKEVRYENKVTWLVSWADNIKGSMKYIMLNPSSRVKGEKDVQKFEMARQLKKCVDRIRAQYRDDWKSKEMRVRQRAVALYFIDRLALRAGNEKEEGETADTVGCCSLRVEHIRLYPEKDGQEYVVEFDFLGKDCIRYNNTVPVERRVFRSLQHFMENKQPGDDLFDRLNTGILNKHLQELMEGLTAKVFRTYNASITLQQQLKELTKAHDSIPAKLLSYNRANRAVAILCNHQRAPPKTFEASMQNLLSKIGAKKEQLSVAKREAKKAKAEHKERRKEKSRKTLESRKKAILRFEEQLVKLEMLATDREENKQVALGTSKLNYLDPRISVAWCKSFDVPIERIYNKSQRDKFACFIDMADEDFEF